VDASFEPRSEGYSAAREFGALRDGRAHTAWIVPPRGAPYWLVGWNPGPVVGWWPLNGVAHWDWEREPPQILVWRGERFAPIAALTATHAATPCSVCRRPASST
jgi:hypothetical protein